MRPRPGTMLDEQEKRLEEPTLEEIEANGDWFLVRVDTEYLVRCTKRRFSSLFENGSQNGSTTSNRHCVMSFQWIPVKLQIEVLHDLLSCYKLLILVSNN
jgi:hypothetical protein